MGTTRTKHSYQFGAFRLDATDRLLYRDGELVPLPPKVIDTLLLLIASRGQVLTKDEMMKRLWPDTFVEEGTLAQYIFLLRKALGTCATWIENHPRRGYRFTAPVEEHNPDLQINEGESRTVIAEEAVQSQPRARLFRLIATALLIVVAATTTAVVTIRGREKASTAVGSVAVLPFRTISDSDDDYRADGITDALITKLANLKGLRVVSYSRVRQFKGASVEAAEIGRKLGVDAVIEGTVRVVSGQMRVSVHAIDATTAYTLWAEDRSDTSAGGLLQVERQLAEAVALWLRGQLTSRERDLITKSGTGKAEAYDLVLRARAALREGGDTVANRQFAVQLLERAVQIDPAFADAYGWLALSQQLAYGDGLGEETLRAAISNANQALSRDPNSLIAMRALAHIQNTTQREVEGLLMAKRALDINPDDLDATAAAAEAYFRAGLSDRALPLYEKALRWEPENAEFRSQLARISFFLAENQKGIDAISALPLSRLGSFGATFGLLVYVETGELDKAVQAIREERAREPRPVLQGFSAHIRGSILEAAGDLAGARQIWSDSVRYREALLTKHENASSHYGLSLAYAKLGNREKALQQLGLLLASDPRNHTRQFQAAETHALLGNRRESLDSLKAAVENGFLNLPMIDGMARSRVCTLYSLRNDREFLAIRSELAGRVEQLRARY